MMRIDNAQLNAFAAVLQEGSFELAAKRLNVTPSAISQRVKMLEDRIGQVLIQRVNPCRPTSAGQVLLRYASEVALLESEAFSALGVREGDAPRLMRIPIVVNADSLDSWFHDVLEAVAQNDSILLDIRVEDQGHSAELLRDGSVMAGVSASASAVQGCRVEMLGMMRYVAVASSSYIAKYLPEGMSAQAMNNAPLLAFNRKDALQAEFISRLLEAPVSPPIHYVPTTRSFLDAICAGLGWGMVPIQMASELLQSGRLQELAPMRWLDVPLYWHCSKINAEPLARLSSMVRGVAKIQLFHDALPDMAI